MLFLRGEVLCYLNWKVGKEEINFKAWKDFEAPQ